MSGEVSESRIEYLTLLFVAVRSNIKCMEENCDKSRQEDAIQKKFQVYIIHLSVLVKAFSWHENVGVFTRKNLPATGQESSQTGGSMNG